MNEKQKKQIKEAEEKEKEEGKKDYKAMYEYAHWRCVQSGAIFRREDVGAIAAHRSKCAFCAETAEEREKAKELASDTRSRMRYAYHAVELAKYDVPRLKQLQQDLERDPESHPEVNDERRIP